MHFADTATGLNPQGQASGVIQQRGITATSFYSQLVFTAPGCIPGNNITFAGLSVTGTGFGQWQQTFQVTGSVCGALNGTIPLPPPGRVPVAPPAPPVVAQPPPAPQRPGIPLANLSSSQAVGVPAAQATVSPANSQRGGPTTL